MIRRYFLGVLATLFPATVYGVRGEAVKGKIIPPQSGNGTSRSLERREIYRKKAIDIARFRWELIPWESQQAGDEILLFDRRGDAIESIYQYVVKSAPDVSNHPACPVDSVDVPIESLSVTIKNPHATYAGFSIGDHVMLKSGGPDMIITDIGQSRGSVCCEWSDGPTEPMVHNFYPPECLTKDDEKIRQWILHEFNKHK